MAVRGDEVASAINALVREGIEKMVGELRSSIEDVREVVDSQLNAALQSVQADVNAITFLPRISKELAELEGPAAAPVKSTGDTSRLKEALQTVERGKSQVDILNALLEQCISFGSRAALLILRGETFSGWKGAGFSTHGGSDEAVKRFNAAPGLLPELDQVLRGEHVVIWSGANLSTRLGVTASEKAVLVPMVIKDKVAAAVYVDAVGEDLSKLDVNALEVLTFTTGLLIDTLAIRKKIPSPSLTEGASAEAAISAPAPAAAPAPAPAPPPRPTPAPAPPAAAPRPAPAGATVAINAAQVQEALAAKAAPRPAAPAAPHPAPAAARPAAPAAHAPSATSALGGDDKPSTQYIPPSGVGRATSASTPATEETKKHDEARRFARLLVSEIKLYNEAKVDQGRKNKDLYERLKEDIDRSRQMYDERIAEDVRKGSNYFYDELVRILADGDAGALGL
jgi:hypothetical protein